MIVRLVVMSFCVALTLGMTLGVRADFTYLGGSLTERFMRSNAGNSSGNEIDIDITQGGGFWQGNTTISNAMTGGGATGSQTTDLAPTRMDLRFVSSAGSGSGGSNPDSNGAATQNTLEAFFTVSEPTQVRITGNMAINTGLGTSWFELRSINSNQYLFEVLLSAGPPPEPQPSPAFLDLSTVITSPLTLPPGGYELRAGANAFSDEGVGAGSTFTALIELIGDDPASPGDYNASGQVEQGDLDLVLQNWGVDTDTAGVPAGWVNDLPSGQIEQTELDGVLQNWGDTSAPGFGTRNVPEPAAAVLLTISAWVWFGRCPYPRAESPMTKAFRDRLSSPKEGRARRTRGVPRSLLW